MAEPTSYLVLSLQGPRDTDAEGKSAFGAWNEVVTVDASSADQAIRKSGQHGVLAVPARSWKPRRVTTETKTVLKVENA